MSKVKKFKININSFVSWAAALIILALGAKMMHYEWATPLVIVGFAVECIVFIVLGFHSQDTPVTNSSSVLDTQIFGDLNQTLKNLDSAINELKISNDINSKVMSTLVNEIGIKRIAESLSKPNEIASLDTHGLQAKIEQTNANYDKMNHAMSELVKVYTNQLNALKAN